MTRLVAWFLLGVAMTSGACARPAAVSQKGTVPGSGDYGGVTREILFGAHVCRATGERRATFHWELHESTFDLTREGGPIPPEVLGAILGRQGDVIAIQGSWSLDGRRLVLSDLRGFEDLGAPPITAPDVTLDPYRTPVVRFEFGETQYVLGP